MKHWHFDSPDPETTAATATELGRSIGAEGLVLGLVGPLGAGKTVFVKGMAAGLGVDPALVSSPTFVIAQQYPTGSTAADSSVSGGSGAEVGPEEPEVRPDVLHHIDLYRLESEDELESIGFFDLFGSGGVLAAEWADRFPDVLGPDRIEIRMQGPADVNDYDISAEPGIPPSRVLRRTEVEAFGDAAEVVLSDWAERVDRQTRMSSVAGGDSRVRWERNVTWLLAVALLGTMSAAWNPNHQPSGCESFRATEWDAWGTARVECADEHGAGAQDSQDFEIRGIGGILLGHPLNLRRATVAELEALPQIGPSRANAIAQDRGRVVWRTLEDLDRVSGIGPKTRARITPWVTLGPESLGIDPANQGTRGLVDG